MPPTLSQGTKENVRSSIKGIVNIKTGGAVSLVRRRHHSDAERTVVTYSDV